MEEAKPEIAFFDLETMSAGQGYAILEFGAILVCPRKLVELHNYSTLVRPSDLSLLSVQPERCNGITRDALAVAPPFSAVADTVFDLLHGRIWAGHNILRFDCPLIREAFAETGRPSPEPKGIIDTLALLTENFWQRACNMKLATLATYFELGKQTHRSLDDVRMNLEVVQKCATVLFLESSFADILASNSWVSPGTDQMTHSSGRVLPVEMNISTSGSGFRSGNHNELLNLVEPGMPKAEGFNVRNFDELIMNNIVPEEQEKPLTSEDWTNSSTFLTPDDVSISSINVVWFPYYRGSRRIQIFHKDVILKLVCTQLKIRFEPNAKYPHQLSFVVHAPQSLCRVLDECDNRVYGKFLQSGSTSEWKPVVNRNWNSPAVRLRIPTVQTGDVAKYGTEIFQKEAVSGVDKKLIFSKFDVAELETLFTPGTYVDAFFSLNPYVPNDYQHNANACIRLVAEKLVIHSK